MEGGGGSSEMDLMNVGGFIRHQINSQTNRGEGGMEAVGSSEMDLTDTDRIIRHQINSPRKRCAEGMEAIGSSEMVCTIFDRPIGPHFDHSKNRYGGSTEEGSSDTDFTNIDTTMDKLDSSAIFHLVSDILGFVLFMHQQIPSVLQDITHEFDELRREYKELESELGQNAVMPISERRKLASRRREVKMEIRKLEKLMNCISNLKNAIQLLIREVPTVEKISLVLGPSLLRPLHVYELCFLHGNIVVGDFSRSKAVEFLSKKAIRTMISRGAGSDTYAGPSKLFFLVKAPSSLNLPTHFLPKRAFNLSRKIIPFRIRFRGRNRDLEMNARPNDCADRVALPNSASNESIWFQCRHIIKGLPSGISPPEE